MVLQSRLIFMSILYSFYRKLMVSTSKAPVEKGTETEEMDLHGKTVKTMKMR